ncbi:MAG: phytanoyl-CoA dioxygenase family protein [Alphaproteobacteria bacterium]|nr:phytanoyl-CoA dioxygenase family protein [Alphaproteobacteria bacterium]
MPKVLSEAQVQRFRDDGLLPAIPVLSPAEVAYFRDRLEAFEAAHPEHVKKLKSKAHLLCPWVDEIARHPRILDVYEDLIGPDILCYSMAFRVKNADGRTFAGWHQDTAYSPIRPILVIGALALGPCGREQGCLSVIPGSHRNGILPHAETPDPDSILARGQYISAELDTSSAVDLTLQPGEIGLFNAGCVHGSRENRSGERRVMLLVEMMPTSVEERAFRDSAMLVRGADRFHNYDADEPARTEAGPEELARWERTIGKRARNVFHNSALPVSEQYGGQPGAGR